METLSDAQPSALTLLLRRFNDNVPLSPDELPIVRDIGWEIRNGKRVRMLKNPSYSGISTEFWNSCVAIAGREHWTLWGVPNCGKGQPEQVMGTGHGASPARFRKIRVGSAYAR